MTVLTILLLLGGLLDVAYSDELTNIDGLSNLTYIGDSLDLNNNATLKNIDGLSKITSINGYLYLWDNEDLTNLDGFRNLTHIENWLYIRDNDSLTDISGLNNLCSVGCSTFPSLNYSDFAIRDNWELCDPDAEALRDQVLECGGICGNSPDISIYGNYGCK